MLMFSFGRGRILAKNLPKRREGQNVWTVAIACKVNGSCSWNVVCAYCLVNVVLMEYLVNN